MTHLWCHTDVMYPITLTGSRVAWREVTPDDAEDIIGWQTTPEIYTYMPADDPLPLDVFRETIASYVTASQQPDRREYSLCLTLDGCPIGTGSLNVRERPPRCAEIGYMLHPDHWGKGLATEAAGLLLTLGFDTLGLHRIEAVTRPDNTASRRILEKLGMTQEGVRRQDVQIRGQWRDSILFAILETDPRPDLHAR